MTANDVLSLLWSNGHTVRLVGETVFVRPTPDSSLCDMIRTHKLEIMARLRKDAEVAAEFRAIARGVRPTWFTLAGRCAKCGPVWLPDWALPEAAACPWCSVPKTVTIPRPTDTRPVASAPTAKPQQAVMAMRREAAKGEK